MDLFSRFERFCLRNRDKGIPNLMLYIVIATGIVTLAGYINGGDTLYYLLCFDKAAILNGQVWRLVTHVFTYSLGGGLVLEIVFLYFFYRLSRTVEQSIGTFKFNLFYLGGIVLMDIFAMIFCPTTTVTVGQYRIDPAYFSSLYSQMGYYLHLSLILAFATTHPDSQFLILFVIPVRAWLIALVYLLLIAINVFNMCYPLNLFPHCLFPLVGLLNYFIFFGKDIGNLLPLSWKVKMGRRKKQARPTAKPDAAPIRFHQTRPETPDYTHKCTVCGRTDKTDPRLEFRYCSRCAGYHCYCADHISNHTHIQ